jgi:hypothetical protein
MAVQTMQPVTVEEKKDEDGKRMVKAIACARVAAHLEEQ